MRSERSLSDPQGLPSHSGRDAEDEEEEEGQDQGSGVGEAKTKVFKWRGLTLKEPVTAKTLDKEAKKEVMRPADPRGLDQEGMCLGFMALSCLACLVLVCPVMYSMH